jgi:hypothetical protein
MRDKKKNTKPKGLTDQELVKKYDTGKKGDFDRALKIMSKSPSPTETAKGRK